MILYGNTYDRSMGPRAKSIFVSIAVKCYFNGVLPWPVCEYWLMLPSCVCYTRINRFYDSFQINETDKDCGPNSGNNFFCDQNIDVSNFLNFNSLRNHDEFCLAYVFTYRDFIGGTLGLACVGSPSSELIISCWSISVVW